VKHNVITPILPGLSADYLHPDADCDLKKGLACTNSDQRDSCEDYMIRFLCPDRKGPVTLTSDCVQVKSDSVYGYKYEEKERT